MTEQLPDVPPRCQHVVSLVWRESALYDDGGYWVYKYEPCTSEVVTPCPHCEKPAYYCSLHDAVHLEYFHAVPEAVAA
ncbi:MAG: hypothetical protein JWN30_2892 [Bacilli bacterium]|nr:hypothetical protein [Bacilli bacterium]